MVKSAIRRMDEALGGLGRRQVLFEFRTAMNLAVLRPMYDALAADPRISCWLTTDDPARGPEACRRAGIEGRLVGRERAAWQRFHLYVNANPWCALNLRRCRRRITFFHGVAGKYDLDQPVGLPMGLERYDRVAFINRDRLTRYLAAGLVRPDQAVLVGYPKIDCLAGPHDVVRRSLGLDPEGPAVLYAPTFSSASSLPLAGEAIVETLLAAGYRVMVKLHERSFDEDPRHSGGIDWAGRLRRFDRPGRFAFIRAADATPYLAAADLLVTDHSSIGFEFLLLDRPLIVFDAPDLPREARINPDKIALLRSAADVVARVEDLVPAVRAALAAPERLGGERRRVADEMFHDAGHATGRALAVIYELLGLPALSAIPAIDERIPRAAEQLR